MVEKLDHLQRLGVTCLELLPLHEFNEMEYHKACPARPYGTASTALCSMAMPAAWAMTLCSTWAGFYWGPLLPATT